MSLEPCQVLHVEAPGLPLQLLGRKVLLVRARVEVEYVKQRLDIKLREDTGCAENRIRLLGVIRRRLEWVSGHVVLRLLGVLWLRHARVASLQEFMHMIEVRHPVRRFLFDVFKRRDKISQ